MKVEFYNETGEKTEGPELPEEIFNIPLNKDLLHQVIVSYQKNQRRSTSHTKDRGEVSGSKKKPWAQKGTGRARHGDRYSPLWRKGGKAHGPRKEQKYKDKTAKKIKRKALAIALSSKMKGKNLFLFKKINLKEPKTRVLEKLLEDWVEKIEKLEKDTFLIVTPEDNEVLKRAGRNLPYVKIETAQRINALDVLKYKYILMVEGSIEILKKRLKV